jgi:alpha-L-arabinofuranosidase
MKVYIKQLNLSRLLHVLGSFSIIRLAPWPVAVLCALVPHTLRAQTPLQANIQVDINRIVRDIPPTLFGANLEWTWNGNLLWDAASNTLNYAQVSMLNELPHSLLRFPGGTFADYYNWRQGIGPQGARPASSPLPGSAVQANNFGTDEALTLARLTGNRLLITVNTITATPADAAAWVQYTNFTSPGPRVDYWEIGNETYLGASSGGSSAVSSAATAYANTVVQFAQAMKAVDPTIKVGAILDERMSEPTYSLWTETVLQRVGPIIDYVAVHNSYAPALSNDPDLDLRTVYRSMLAAPIFIEQNLASLTSRIDALVPSRAGAIQIAVTEWGPFFSHNLNSRFLDHNKTLASALYTSSALMTFLRQPRVHVANFFKINDPLFMGMVGFRNWMPAPTASYLAFQMFGQLIGSRVIGSTTTVSGFDSVALGWVSAASDVPYLDVLVTQSADRKKCFVTAINKSFDLSVDATINLGTARPEGTGTVWLLTGTATDANTGTGLPIDIGVTWAVQAHDPVYSRFLQGSPTEVQISSTFLCVPGSVFHYLFPPFSVTSIEIPLRSGQNTERRPPSIRRNCVEGLRW